MSGKRYYAYQGHSGHRRGGSASDGLFGWTVFIFLLIGFVFFCWMGSYYIFAHPEKGSNYRLLQRLHKIDPPQRFEITAAPRGEFLKPGQLLERFGSMSASEIRRANENLLRNFLRNYHQIRDLVPYAVGTYRVIGTVPLSDKTFCQPGVVALLQAVEQPEVLLEQLFTAEEKNIPALQRALVAGQEIKLEKPLDLSAIVHIERLPDNRIMLSTMPLLYGSYGAGPGKTSFSLEPPQELNLDVGLPVLRAAEVADLSGGKVARPKDPNSLRLRRIAEEMATPTPEPRVAKALPAGAPQTAVTEAKVARAIPVNGQQPVLPAIPVATPLSAPATPVAAALPALPAAATAVQQAIPQAIPVGTPLPVPVPSAAPVVPPPAAALPPPAAATNALSVTNQPVAASQEAWPVYAAGQMPRGRLVDAADGQELAGKGVGGERHYLKGRFTVTASGNGRAVLRPQGSLAGVPMGASSRVRVIVEFPAGAIPPTEGNSVSRDNLRPFQITSVKRGDDGQINIYAREVTRGQ
jgi:hypothetical protein